MQTFPNKLYLSEHVRECDRLAMAQCGLSTFSLMQQAAEAVWTVINQRWVDVKKIAVFCGTGNNGGDGYLVATLALTAGLEVVVYSLAECEKLTGDALTAYQSYVQAGGRVLRFSQSFAFEPQLIVDAMLGTGLARSVSGDYAQAIDFINNYFCPVLAVDIPSGLNADTGNCMGCAVQADVTVSFVALKQGLFTADSKHYAGEILYADLGIPPAIFKQVPHSAQRLLPSKLPRRHRTAHKGHYGHVVVIGGDVGFSGAARLAAEAALRIGAGLVSIATRATHAAVMNSGRFELMSHAVENVPELIPLMTKASVLVVGTGLGQQWWGQTLFAAAIQQSQPIVIDADALNLLAKQPVYQTNRILTPHPGEAARLLSCTTAEIAADRFTAVRQLQKIYGGVCVLKGAGTLICDGNSVFVAEVGNPGMASGGMGDVLAGMIGGLLAQGFSLIDAAKIGVYVHGAAADLAAARGERGLLASDLMSYIRELVN